MLTNSAGMRASELRWYISACPVCAGALYEDALDRGWASCMMCGRSFPVTELQRSSRSSTERSIDADDPHGGRSIALPESPKLTSRNTAANRT
jgi:hypothetical protein